jgi:DNA-binding LytR/AlgR family response regulator
MGMYNCIIVDDSEIDQLSLKAFLSKFPNFKILGTFTSPVKALEIIGDIEIDVLFLDIQMPDINGLEFRKKARSIPVCVFISYSQDYAVESFELETLDYIVKPLRFERFEKTIQKIESYMTVLKRAELNTIPDNVAFIKNGNQQVKIILSEILYLEAFSDYTNIVAKTGKEIISSNIGSILKESTFLDFLRIHRSYAIPKTNIYKINRNQVILNDGTVLPIGKTYKENILQSL